MKIQISVIFYLERGLDVINGRPDLNNLNRTFLYIDILVGATITLKNSLLTSQIFRIEQSQGNRYWFLAIIYLDRSSCDVSQPNGKCKEHFFSFSWEKALANWHWESLLKRPTLDLFFLGANPGPKAGRKDHILLHAVSFSRFGNF